LNFVVCKPVQNRCYLLSEAYISPQNALNLFGGQALFQGVGLPRKGREGRQRDWERWKGKKGTMMDTPSFRHGCAPCLLSVIVISVVVSHLMACIDVITCTSHNLSYSRWRNFSFYV